MKTTSELMEERIETIKRVFGREPTLKEILALFDSTVKNELQDQYLLKSSTSEVPPVKPI